MKAVKTLERRNLCRLGTWISLALLSAGPAGTWLTEASSMEKRTHPRQGEAGQRLATQSEAASNGFVEAASQGFGDHLNTWPWSMQWWNGKLYVGTNRAWKCVSTRAINRVYPDLFPYPPTDPDVDCAEDPNDLLLRAEIWRLTPETGGWEMVYRSDEIPIPEQPDKMVGFDIGFRDMLVFQEPGGPEALYVAGVSSRSIHPDVDPPRILRSTDGVHFTPLPNDPGTVLGDVSAENAGFRSITAFRDRLYVTATNITGFGVLLESADPAGGNDNFRQVTDPDVQVFETFPFNDYLYVGTADTGGYAVLKTDAEGEPPYNLTVVVPPGAFAERSPARGVVSMYEYDGRLHVGSDTPAELLRIDADDTWEILAGRRRPTPDGWKYPLSGLTAGFGFRNNIHVWRMIDYEGRLFASTLDLSTFFKETILGGRMERNMGFDLFDTANGFYFHPITFTGLGNRLSAGVRTFAQTPAGLYMGASNNLEGLQIWQRPTGYQPALEPPQRLEIEFSEGGTVLSWDAPAEAALIRVYRFEASVISPESFKEIGATNGTFFVDSRVNPNKQFLYYVTAENSRGLESPRSNLVEVPLLAPPVTFPLVIDFVLDLAERGKFVSAEDAEDVVDGLNIIANQVLKSPDWALKLLEALREIILQQVSEGQTTPGEVREGQRPLAGFGTAMLVHRAYASDLEIMLDKLIRRMRLSQLGLIDPKDLL